MCLRGSGGEVAETSAGPSGGRAKADGGRLGVRARMAAFMTPQSLCACCGAGLLLAWLFSLLCFEGVIYNDPFGDVNRHDPFFLAATLSTAVCGLVAWLFSGCRALATRCVRSAVGAGGVSLILLAVSLVMCLATTQPAWCPMVCGVMAGVGFFLLVFGWFGYFSACDLQVVGYLFFCMLFVTFAALWLVFMFWKGDVRKVVHSTLVCCYLLGSVLLFRASDMRALEGLDAMTSTEAAQGVTGRLAETPAIVGKTALFALATSFASMFVWIYDIKVGQTSFLVEVLEVGLVPWSYITSGTVVMLLFLMLLLMSRRSGFVMLSFHRMCFLAIVLAYAMALGGKSWFFGTYTLAHLAFFLSQMGVWVVLVRASYLFDCAPMRHIGLILTSQYLGDALAFAAFRCVSLDTWAGDTGGLLLVGLLAVICVVFLFVFTEADVKVVDRISVSGPGDAIDAACADIGRRGGLTPREVEVLALLARGKNAVSIHEDLGVTYNTIKTHKQNIYGKLGLHSQQELLAYVEGYRR